MEVRDFLDRLHDQIYVSGAAGCATGRNIHEKGLEDARLFCDAIYAIVMEDMPVDAAMRNYWGTRGMTKVVLLRHGQSLWNKEGRFTGWIDVDLSPEGRQEAKEAGQRLKKRAYCSIMFLHRSSKGP